MNIIDFGETLYATTPKPTAAQYADARRLVLRDAPDLADMLGFGAA